MQKEEIAVNIRKCLSAISNHEPSEDELLFETGILDSFDLIEFIILIEKNFQITIKPEDVILDNFSSINSLNQYLQSILK